MKSLLQYQGVRFIIKFLLVASALYFFNKFYIGITAPGGTFYSAFLNEHLNYISWIRTAILHTSNVMAHGLGMSSYVETPYWLRTNTNYVRIVYDCIGYGVMSFWIAFVVANNSTFSKKAFWCVTGIAAFFAINCFRIAILLLAQQNKWSILTWMDHHTMFNIVTYILIFGLGYLFTKKSTLQHTEFAVG